MNHKEVVPQLRWQSTQFLFFINLVTLGLYSGLYIVRQSLVMNRFLDKKNSFSYFFMGLVVLLKCFTTLILMVALFAATIDDFVYWFIIALACHFLVWFMVIVWAIEARSRLHRIMQIAKGQLGQLNLLWSVLFVYLYFNSHINWLDHKLIEQYAAGRC